MHIRVTCRWQLTTSAGIDLAYQRFRLSTERLCSPHVAPLIRFSEACPEACRRHVHAHGEAGVDEARAQSSHDPSEKADHANPRYTRRKAQPSGTCKGPKAALEREERALGGGEHREHSDVIGIVIGLFRDGLHLDFGAEGQVGPFIAVYEGRPQLSRQA